MAQVIQRKQELVYRKAIFEQKWLIHEEEAMKFRTEIVLQSKSMAEKDEKQGTLEVEVTALKRKRLCYGEGYRQ